MYLQRRNNKESKLEGYKLEFPKSLIYLSSTLMIFTGLITNIFICFLEFNFRYYLSRRIFIGWDWYYPYDITLTLFGLAFVCIVQLLNFGAIGLGILMLALALTKDE